MTTVDEAREQMQQRWVDNWTATEYVFENESNSEKRLGAGTRPWVRFAVRNLDGGQATLGGIGNRIYDRDAKVYMQVMSPVDAGMKVGADLAHAARALYEGVRVGEMVGFGGVVRETKPDGKWYVTLAEVAFQYYERK